MALHEVTTDDPLPTGYPIALVLQGPDDRPPAEGDRRPTLTVEPDLVRRPRPRRCPPR